MKKGRILIVICVILAVISVALGGYIIYDKVNESKIRNETSTPKAKDNENNAYIQQNYIQNESEKDITIYGGDDKFTAYLDNGNLYYQINDDTKKKYSELTNIKKIKAFSYGTSMRFELFLITESGKVYSTIEFFDEELTFTEAEIFKSYEVEDIISKTGEAKEEFSVLLKNGSIVTLTRSMDNEDNADAQEDNNTDIQQDLIQDESDPTNDYITDTLQGQNGKEIELHVNDIYDISAYLDNGYLYYQLNGGTRKKYTELANIKKIKIFNYGTSMRLQFFLITENGKVYDTIELFDDELTFTEAEIFKDYEVEDIISHSGEIIEDFVVLLKNGKTITVTRSLDS